MSKHMYKPTSDNPKGDRPPLFAYLPRAIALGLLTVGLAMGTPHPVQAESMEPHAMPTEQTGQFQPIEQPLLVKGAVTVVGLALIGLELWWFLFSRPKAD